MKQKYQPEDFMGERLHDMCRSQVEITCPFCGVPYTKVKRNGDGYYRCKGKCRKEFFIAIDLQLDEKQ